MRITSGTANCPPDICGDGGGIVDDLVECQKAEVHRHDLDDGPHAGHGCADAGADKGQFGQRRVADAVLAEFFEQALGDGVAAAVARHVLAHQEHSLVGRGSPSRIACLHASR